MGSDGRITRWSWLGQVPYATGVALQEAIRERVKRGDGDEHLLLLEHPAVYTLGRNATDAHVTAPAEWLALQGIETHESDRGGQVTYHGPGQLVGYPVLDLAPDRKDVRRYVDDLQEVLIRTLERFGVAARRKVGRENIGVWVEDQKIASIGVHLSRWVTTHGFALNVTTDLDHFRGIVACGLQGVRMASVESVAGRRLSLPAVARVVAEVTGDVYGRRMVEVPGEELWAMVPAESRKLVGVPS